MLLELDIKYTESVVCLVFTVLLVCLLVELVGKMIPN